MLLVGVTTRHRPVPRNGGDGARSTARLPAMDDSTPSSICCEPGSTGSARPATRCSGPSRPPGRPWPPWSRRPRRRPGCWRLPPWPPRPGSRPAPGRPSGRSRCTGCRERLGEAVVVQLDPRDQGLHLVGGRVLRPQGAGGRRVAGLVGVAVRDQSGRRARAPSRTGRRAPRAPSAGEPRAPRRRSRTRPGVRRRQVRVGYGVEPSGHRPPRLAASTGHIPPQRTPSGGCPRPAGEQDARTQHGGGDSRTSSSIQVIVAVSSAAPRRWSPTSTTGRSLKYCTKPISPWLSSTTTSTAAARTAPAGARVARRASSSPILRPTNRKTASACVCDSCRGSSPLRGTSLSPACGPEPVTTVPR